MLFRNPSPLERGRGEAELLVVEAGHREPRGTKREAVLLQLLSFFEAVPLPDERALRVYRVWLPSPWERGWG